MTDVLAPLTTAVVIFGDFTFDFETRKVLHASGKNAHLRPECYWILRSLAESKGEVVTKEMLYKNIRERRLSSPDPKIVDVQVCYLRGALDTLASGGGDHIITRWGEGYLLSNTPQPRKNALRALRGSRNKGLIRRLNEEQAA